MGRRSCEPECRRLSYRPPTMALPGSDTVHWFGVLFATIGAGAVLGALTFVSLLVGALINLMIVLFAGPVIDRVLARRQQ